MCNNRKTMYIPISGEKLRRAIELTGLSVTALETELGCGQAISNAIKRDKISKPIFDLLEIRYGIGYDSIQAENENNAFPELTDEFWDRLHETIKEAVKEAFNV